MPRNYVAEMVANVRRDTRNLDTYSATNQTGISDQDVLRALQYAQERLFGLIIKSKPTSFLESKDIAISSSSDGYYTINDNLYLAEAISDVKYSWTGQARDYRELRERDFSYANFSDYSQDPDFYVRRNGRILLCPRPTNQSAVLRVSYRREPDLIELRRGTITAAGFNGSGQLVTLSVNPATDDAEALGTAEYLCITDRYGAVKMYNVLITSYDSGTGAFTLPAFTPQAGETAPVGGYVTVGKYSTTHHKFPTSLTRFIEVDAVVRLFDGDSSDDAARFRAERSTLEREIVDNYDNAADDELEIQIDDDTLIVEG